MLCRTFKNGNFTIQHEAAYDGDVTTNFHYFPLWIAEHADGFDVLEVGDFECWGNSYGAFPLTVEVNGERGIYYITPDDAERFAAGYMVRVKRDSLAPLFVLPSFYKFVSWWDKETNRKGILYTLCEDPTPEEREAMRWAGCKLYTSRAQYAPELERCAVFVPNGTPFEFC